jgi:two-component system, chemotaxis family, protein-glutamate methylesterase/glutaminase
MPQGTPAPRALVVVGGSAGGVEALRELVAGLPADLPAAVLVVVHVPPTGKSALPVILSRRGPLPARHAEDGAELRAGEVLVAPPDHHLVVIDGRVGLTRGPQENGHRPAVDVLFRSAARSWGPRVVAVVLSGALDDGAAGVVAVKHRGGRCMVQADALFDGMPTAASRAHDPDAELPVAEIPGRLTAWLDDLPEEPGLPVSALIEEETEMAELDPRAMHDLDRPGEPAGFGCPDCAGSLYRIEEGKLTRFRCRVGHAWSPESLLVRQTVALESALWMALRSLEEKVALNTELGQRASAEGRAQTAQQFESGAVEAMRAAELVRQLVVDLGPAPGETDAVEPGSA